jgi:C4-type Zn-finger protein
MTEVLLPEPRNVFCVHCGYGFTYQTEEKRIQLYADMIAHDGECDLNPTVIQLRAALATITELKAKIESLEFAVDSCTRHH